MNIDIINVAFLLCCKSFNIEMAKWLYDLVKNDLKIEIDVTIDDDYALLLACNGNQIEMVELLCSLNKNYSYTKNNSGNLIPKIRNLRNDLKEIYRHPGSGFAYCLQHELMNQKSTSDLWKKILMKLDIIIF